MYIMFAFLLGIVVSFCVVSVGRMPCSCAATFLFFGKRHPHPQLPSLLSWTRRCAGRARSDRYISWLIGVRSVAGRNIPKDSCGLIVSMECGNVRCCVRCLPAFNGTHIY